jgi:hypothetical protein
MIFGRPLAVSVGALALLGGGIVAPIVVPAAGSLKAVASSPWKATQLRLPAGGVANGAGFAGPVSCPAIGGCVVLGEYSTSSGLEENLIATEKAGVWSDARAPLPPGGTQATNLGPYTLICTGVGNCVGTSLYQSATAVAADILEDNLGTWSAVAMPLPKNAAPARLPTISGMSCLRRGDCVIVGTYVTTTGLSEGLVVTQVDKVFAAAEAPTPGAPNRGAALTGVSCVMVTSCVAVGDFATPGDREPLFVVDNAGALSGSRALLPLRAAGNPQSELQAVSCSPTVCIALGSYVNLTGDRLGVIETGEVTGATTTWTARRTPSPPGASPTSPSPQIYSVRCKITIYCLAVGRYTDASGKTQGLVLLAQAGRWSASMMPGTLNSGVVVRAVTCASETSCVAVGQYLSGGRELGYIMSLSGSTLSGGTAPEASSAMPSRPEDLEFVACRYIAICTASGTYNGAAEPVHQLPLVVSEGAV